MTLLLLIAAAIAAWAWRSGRLGALRPADLMGVAAVLVGLALLGRGRAAAGLVALGGAGLYALLRTRRRVPRPASSLEAREASALLELPPGADADAIRAAHRRLIARVHPDAGGTAELARRVNRARDVLLARAAAEPQPAGAVRRP